MRYVGRHVARLHRPLVADRTAAEQALERVDERVEVDRLVIADVVDRVRRAARAPAAADARASRTTPSTMSSMYVKSRSILPALKTSIGRPSTIAFVNSIGAWSGRPHGPYTVKKRRPVVGIRNRWL